jgi:hypothetical protein
VHIWNTCTLPVDRNVPELYRGRGTSLWTYPKSTLSDGGAFWRTAFELN